MTTWSRSRFFTVCETLYGSKGSKSSGLPVLTLQKAQALVQVSPIIIKVACFFDQHSPRFGQLASSQTVTTLPFLIISFVTSKFFELDNLDLIHFGFGKTDVSLLLIFSGCLIFVKSILLSKKITINYLEFKRNIKC